MDNRQRFLFVILDSDGVCWRVLDDDTERCTGLPSLLAEGWRPIRETPYHYEGYILILLERDAGDPSGFGFSS